MGLESEARLLSKIGFEAEILDSGCCGMAGSFGFEAGESQLIHQDAQRTYALIFDKGDEFISEITRLTKEQKLDASHFMALGAFRSAVLGFFDMESERPREFPWRLRLRCYPWSATLPPRMVPPRLMRTWCSAKMMALPSTAISRRSHLAHLEVVLTESPSHLCRRTDEETGLAVIEFQSLVANDYLIVRRCSRIAGTPKAVCQVQHAAPHPDECFPGLSKRRLNLMLLG